jgi:sulfatase maturation enzyme AslB (radical SAM superfamily)
MATLAQVDFLALVLTSRCNFACSYCFQNDRQGSSMCWETLRRALELGLRSEKRPFHFFFTGGEPLLELGLIRRAVRHLDERRRSADDFSYELSSNGALLTPAISGFLEQHRFQVQVSFDGVADAQNLRSKGSFVVLDKLLDRLRLRHQDLFENRLRVHITVSPAGVRYLADSVSYLIGKDCRQISIGSAFCPTARRVPDMRGQLSEQFTRILDMSLRHYRRRGTVPVVLFVGREPGKEPADRRFLCRMQELNTLTVDSDGRAYACAFFAQSYQRFPSRFLENQVRPLDLGLIDAPDFAEKCAWLPEVAVNLPIFLDRSKKYSSYGRCGNCPYVAECTVCPISIGQIPGNTDPDRVPDFLCAFNQVTVAHRRLFWASRKAASAQPRHD